MSKHTPGPWYVGGPTEYCFQLAIEPSIGAAYGGGEEVQANAHLIAAAPQMLAVLEGLTEGPLSLNELNELMADAREVIAKAKGEA